MNCISRVALGRRSLRTAVLLLVGLVVVLGLLEAAPTGAAPGDPATLTITKETDPDGGTGFPFTLQSDGPALMWGSYGTGDGQFDQPFGGVVDGAGNIYLTDNYNSRIQKYDGSGAFLAKWGSYGSGDGQFYHPADVAIDTVGNLYVAESWNNRIQKSDGNGLFLSKWGSTGSGDGQFNRPQSVAIDSAGNVYVADSSNNRIQKFDTTGTFLAKWGSYGNGNGQFINPYGVAVDAAGNVYVADRGNNRIQKFTGSGAFLAKWGSAGSGDGQFSSPADVGVDSAGYVYVADTSNHRIQKFTNSGGFVTKWGSYGSSSGQFINPHSLTVGNTGDIYVSDTQNHRIQKFTSASPTLADGDSVTYTLDPAPYRLGETVLSGWSVASIACDGGSPQVFGTAVGLTLAEGEDVECVFTNEVAGSSLIVVKEVVGAAPGSDWSFSGTLGAFTLPAAGGYQVFGDLDTGDYTINETAAAGYDQEVSCSSGESGVGSVTVGLTPGEIATCVFRNTAQPATITLTKETDPDGGSGFPFTLVSGGPSLILGKGPASAGQLAFPQFVAVNRQGSVYVADTNNNRIQIFDALGTPLSQFGSAGSGDGQFSNPRGVAIDGAGNLYVVDSGNNRIQKFTSSGVFITKWGSSGSGDGQFNYPYGVAVDVAGNVYVADGSNARVQKFDSSGTFLLKWGSYGSGDEQFRFPAGVALDALGNVIVVDSTNHRVQKFASDGVFLTKWGSVGSGNGQFNSPRGVAVDSAGNVFVGDSNNHRIQKFSDGGVFISKWGSVGSGDGQFNGPYGVAVDGVGNVYVADRGNNRIQKFTSSGTYLAQWGKTNDPGDFNSPTRVTVDGAGNVYVSDKGNQRIQVFDAHGTFVHQWGSSGSGNGQFNAPQGVAIDGSGNVFVADYYNNRIQKFDSSGTFLMKWGTSGSGASQFLLPIDVAIDSIGNVYVADSVNSRIQKFTATGAYVTQWGTSGSANGQFNEPRGLAVDSNDNIYVADTGNGRVQIFSSDGTFLGKWGTSGNSDGQFSFSHGISIDPEGNVYVVEASVPYRIQKFTSDGTFLAKWSGSGTNPGQFNSPEGVVVDAHGNMYVADTDNHRIQKFVDAATTLDDGGSAAYTLDAATFVAAEDVPAGWTLSSIACDGGSPQVNDDLVTLTLLPGTDITCDFTNSQDGSITIVKEVVGPIPASNWQFSGDLGSFTLPAVGGQSDPFDGLVPGDYTITETLQTGYSQSVVCDSGETGTGSVTVSLQPGEDVICTFTNTADPGSITIVKEVVGQVPGSDWDYTGDLDVFTLPAAGGQTTFDPLAAGDYTVNETAKAGYTQAVVCDSGETGTGSVTVSLQPGEDVTCTFTNTADPGSITIVKDVVGQVPGSDWDYTGDLGAFSIAAAGGAKTFDNLAAGSYTVMETAKPGYAQSVSCLKEGPSLKSAIDPGTAMIDLQPGEDVTCTFTNTAEPGSITIAKEVVGQVPGSDWDYTGDLDVFTLPAAGGQTTFDPLAAGDYTVNETAKTGYLQAVVCDSGETGMGSVTVSLQPGEDVTCTFTNTADPGSITIVKDVVGQVPGSDWDYTGDLGSFSIAAAGGTEPFSGLAAGDYTVNETAKTGYSQAVVCDSGESGTGSVTVSLQPGEDVICTFTNTADPGSITIVKEVVGQIPAADWDYTGDLGAFSLAAAGGQTAFDPLAAGDYTVNETAKAGYSQEVICDSGESGTGSVTVSLQPGEDVICTFTNTAEPGSITVTKAIVGDGTGTFTICVDDDCQTFDGDGAQQTWSVAAGQYTLSEQDAGPEWIEPTDQLVTVNPGQALTIVVTNVYDPPITNFCPADDPDVGLYLTDLLGVGQPGRTRKIVVPYYSDLAAIYGQLVALDIGTMRYVRFLPFRQSKIEIHEPTSLAYQGAAVSWWGSHIEPAKYVKGQFFWGAKANKSPRAFVLWPTYNKTESYANVLTLFDESRENHVAWEPGWIQQQTQMIPIPLTQANGAEISVQIALVDVNTDGRPVILTVGAGGVSETRVITGPNRKEALNLEEFLLTSVPAGTESVTITLLSPSISSEYPFGGDSAAMIGAAVSYPCAIPQP